MKTMYDLVPKVDEFFIGQRDSINRMLDSFSMDALAQPVSSYPPYNILVGEETSKGQTYTIQIAVAGFKRSDLKVTLRESQMMPKLEVQGSVSRRDDPKVEVGDALVNHYQYRGIASRHFVRSFILERGCKVLKVKLEDGLLNITLLNPTYVNKDSVETLKVE